MDIQLNAVKSRDIVRPEIDDIKGRIRNLETKEIVVSATGILASVFDTKGDILVGTADDAYDNLLVGANNTILTADSAQTTGVKWSTIATASLADDSVTNAKLRNSVALSVIGRGANSTGDPADISTTASSDDVLRESGSILGFGKIVTNNITDGNITTSKIADNNVTTAKILDNNVTTAKLADDSVTNAKLRNSVALSVIGRSANSVGDPDNIIVSAGSNGVLRESGSILGFGQLVGANLTDSIITNNKLADMVQARIKGRALTAGTGAPADLTPADVNEIVGSVDLNNANVIRIGVATDEGTGQMGTTHLKVKSDASLFYRESADIQPPSIEFLKRRSGTATVLNSGDQIGAIVWTGADSTTFGAIAAKITVEVATTAGAADMPGRMIFHTTPDGSGTPVESFRITSNQHLLMSSGKSIGIGIGNNNPLSELDISSDTIETSLLIEAHGGVATPGESKIYLYGTQGTRASSTATQVGDVLGGIYFQGYDTARSSGAAIKGIATAEWGTAGDTTDNPTDLVFYTVPNGSSTLTERMRITDSGLIGVGIDTPSKIVDIRGASSSQLGIYNTSAYDSAAVDQIEFNLNTSTAIRNVFNISASWTDPIDGVRNSLVKFSAAENGTFGTALSIFGNKIGISNTSPQQLLHVGAGADASAMASCIAIFTTAGATAMTVRDSLNDVEAQMYAGSTGVVMGAYTNDPLMLRTNNTTAIYVTTAQKVGISDTTPDGKLSVVQSSTTAAIPVIELTQNDLSEEMINFSTTVGTGNPIEAIGAKTLTTTHFVRVAFNGTFRYIPIGTIA